MKSDRGIGPAARLTIGALATLSVLCVGLGAAAIVSGDDSVPTAQDAAADGLPRAAHEAGSPDIDADALIATDDIALLADPDWIAETANSTGIPERALRAYSGASIRANELWPYCNLGWNTLAAIGWVETHHGTIYGGTIDPDGRLRPALVGVALDGTSTEAIPDTDGGELDNDTRWDRAVGPMQIIPGTWRDYAMDGNADGVYDPQHIDDATLTAAAILCSHGGDLQDPAVWIDAIAGYNSPVSYNNEVAAAADQYAARSR